MSYTKPLFWTLVCFSMFLMLQVCFKYHFYYAEQLQLFLYTGTYASDVIFQLGGISLYMARFLMQFYLLPAFGAACSAVLLTAACLMTQEIIERIAPVRNTFLLSVIPSCGLLWLIPDMNYSLQGVVAYLWMLAALLLYIRITHLYKRIAAGLLLAVLLFWIAGATAALFAVMALLLDVMLKKPKALLSTVYLAALLITGLTAIRMGWQAEYRMVFLPDAYYDPLLHSKTVYFAWVALPACMLVATRLRNSRRKKTSGGLKKDVTLLSVQLVPLVCFLCLLPNQHQGVQHRNIQQDYYLRTQQWDNIIDNFPGDGKGNLQTFNVLNLALAQKGLLGSRLFSYNKQGYQTLLADWNSSLPNAMALSDVYYHIGDIGVAQKYAFEGLVASTNDGNVRSMLRLIETNILFGEYPVAEKYITILDKTLFYRKEAREYRQFLYDDMLVEQSPVLGPRRKALVNNNVYAVSDKVMNTLEALANNNPAGQLAMQYLLALCLTNKDLKLFRTILEKYFRTAVLPVLSPVQQEAVIALEQNNSSFWIRNGVSIRTEQRFRTFEADISNPHVLNFEEKIRADYGDTYWYYVLFTNTRINRIDESGSIYDTDYQPRRL